MGMTKKEYQLFIAKYELLGHIEIERKNKETISLNFLDEIQRLVGTNNTASLSESKLKTKILVRQILNKLPENAFIKF